MTDFCNIKLQVTFTQSSPLGPFAHLLIDNKDIYKLQYTTVTEFR